MPTFENGWICRECWTANREFDSHCYRCHSDRPDDAGTLTLPVRTTERAAPALAETPPMTEPTPKRVTGLVGGAATAAKPEGHCPRCGHRLRDRANYCTGCGIQVSGAAPQVAAGAPEPRPTEPAIPTREVPVARVGAVRDQLSRTTGWLRVWLRSIRAGVAAGRAALAGVGTRVTLARPSLPLVAAVLLLGSFTLFALTARLLVGLTSGQLVFMVAGAAILSAFASTAAVLATADARSGAASTEARLRTLDELLRSGRVAEAEHAMHRAALLANLSGLDVAGSAKPAPAKVARSSRSAADVRPSPTPAR